MLLWILGKCLNELFYFSYSARQRRLHGEEQERYYYLSTFEIYLIKLSIINAKK